MQLLTFAVNLAVVAVCLGTAPYLRIPFFAPWRPWLLIALLAASAIVILTSGRWWRWRGSGVLAKLGSLTCLGAVVAALISLWVEAQFQLARRAVFSADAAHLERVGRHVIVGYRDLSFVRDLVERRAIAGIFLSRRNVEGRDVASIAAEIAELQSIRTRQGLPPLWVAADQEGGPVSRMSPPLPRPATLAQIIRGHETTEQRQQAVSRHAREQARALASLGINLNFAPVVDLNIGRRNPTDQFTRIWQRAIGSDPELVADVAGTYCFALAAEGVRCTLKHFPGLGRVFEDTHLGIGKLDASLEDLARTDWVPFRHLLGRAPSVLMIGHVQVAKLDASNPSSLSRRIVADLLRTEWRYDGLIVTDDMCMGAVYLESGGIGVASVKALDAGVDLLLVSWDGEQVYPVLAALLDATAGPQQARFAASQRRLARDPPTSAGVRPSKTE